MVASSQQAKRRRRVPVSQRKVKIARLGAFFADVEIANHPSAEGCKPYKITSSMAFLCEQDKNRSAPLLSETPWNTWYTPVNEIGKCQHFLRVLYLKQLKNEIHAHKTRLAWIFGNDSPPPLTSWRKCALFCRSAERGLFSKDGFRGFRDSSKCWNL